MYTLLLYLSHTLRAPPPLFLPLNTAHNTILTSFGDDISGRWVFKNILRELEYIPDLLFDDYIFIPLFYRHFF